MTERGAGVCRRALWEMREIAAAASLTDSPMTDQEALHTLSAIAAWVEAEAPRDGAACRAVIHLVIELTGAVDIEALDDGEAETLFHQVEEELGASSRA